jgi:hypothetical protein
MPRIASWADLPQAVRDHLVLRLRERSISIQDLNQLRIWVESAPITPACECISKRATIHQPDRG